MSRDLRTRLRPLVRCLAGWPVRAVATLAWLVVVLVGAASAQEATILGKVTDVSGADVAGVAIHAVQTESGNEFDTVTDERGLCRLPVRVGPYRVMTDLMGFASVARPVTLLECLDRMIPLGERHF
jgi:hypothetical protein